MWLNMGDSEKVSHDIQGTKTINSPNLYHENTNLLPKFPNSQIPVHSCFKLIHKQNFTRKKREEESTGSLATILDIRSETSKASRDPAQTIFIASTSNWVFFLSSAK